MSTQSTVHPETNAPHTRKSSSDGHSLADAVESEAPELKARVREMVETGKKRVTEWKGGLEDGIRDRPIQSVLIAAAVGAVVGVLLGRRTS